MKKLSFASAWPTCGTNRFEVREQKGTNSTLPQGSSQRPKGEEGQALQIQLVAEEKQLVLLPLSGEAPESGQSSGSRLTRSSPAENQVAPASQGNRFGRELDLSLNLDCRSSPTICGAYFDRPRMRLNL